MALPKIPLARYPLIVWNTSFLLTAALIFSVFRFSLDVNFSLRSLAYFISLPIFYAFGVHCSKHRVVNDQIILIVSLVWLLTAIIQKFFLPGFANGLLNSMRTTPDRGVTSLATEPSFYAIQMALILMLNWSTPRSSSAKSFLGLIKTGTISEILLVLQIVFLAQSSLGILILLLFYFMRAASKIPLASITTIAILILLIMAAREPAINYLYSVRASSRVVNLIWKAFKHPEILIASDQSMGERLTDIVVSLNALFSDNMINIGKNTTEWPDYVKSVIKNFSFLNRSAGGARIMSGFGTAVFELGTAGLFIFCSFMVPLARKSRKAVIVAISLAACLTNATQLALPLVGILLGQLTFAPPRKTTIHH